MTKRMQYLNHIVIYFELFIECWKWPSVPQRGSYYLYHYFKEIRFSV